MNRLFPIALCLVAALTACSSTDATSNGMRTVVVLSADQAVRIVVPAGFGESTTAVVAAPATSGVPTTTAAVPTAEATASETTMGAPTGDGAEDTYADGGDTDEDVPQEAPTESASTDETPATTSTTTTTTVAPVKDTIPLAEEKAPPGIQMMNALEEFNGCLEEEGVEFIGRPDATLGDGALVNQPAYVQALTLCAARSGIIDAMQEFQMSRVDRTPETIREDNEQFIALTGCLRSKGWTISDPMPDADGSLGPGDDFRGPDGGVDMDEIRSCISELSLLANE
ncbi:MAG: hypothetical protein HOM00_00890 [Acidimicrobiaceae bacterium]|nr:hypothetical protein [Acidimicrobiaceae bacterium]